MNDVLFHINHVIKKKSDYADYILILKDRWGVWAASRSCRSTPWMKRAASPPPPASLLLIHPMHHPTTFNLKLLNPRTQTMSSPLGCRPVGTSVQIVIPRLLIPQTSSLRSRLWTTVPCPPSPLPTTVLKKGRIIKFKTLAKVRTLLVLKVSPVAAQFKIKQTWSWLEQTWRLCMILGMSSIKFLSSIYGNCWRG